jgi:subtilisin family serine protease
MRHMNIVLLLVGVTGIAMGADHVAGKVIASIPHAYLTLPNGRSSALANEVSAHDSLRAVMRRFGVETVQKVFPQVGPEDTLARAKDGSTVTLLDLSTIYRLSMGTDGDVDGLVRALAGSFTATFAEPDFLADFCLKPYDTRYGDQWALCNTGQGGGSPGSDLGAEGAWDLTSSSPSIRIGIYDSGVDPDHPDFGGGKIAGGKNYEGEVDDYTDDYFHGTYVAGLVGARTNNDYGIAGVAGGWRGQNLGSQLWVFRLGMYDFPLTNAAQAIVDGYTTYGIDVMNCSWGKKLTYSKTLRAAMTNALLMGCIQVCAKGQSDPVGVSSPHFPSDFGDGGRGNIAVAVGATDNADNRWLKSNRGNSIDLMAPGVDILSTMPTYKTDSMQEDWKEFHSFAGTSASTPLVSGTATLLLSYGPSLSSEDVVGMLRTSAKDLPPAGYDDYTGYGRLDALQALRRAMGPYEVEHLQVGGGCYERAISDQFVVQWPFGPPMVFPQTDWVARYHEVRKDVAFPHAYIDCDVWGRTQGTIGTSLGDGPAFTGSTRVLYGEGWCDTVGGTLTGTGVTLKTYTFEIWRSIAGIPYEFYDWLPCQPYEASFAYTVNGRRAFTGVSSFESEEPLPYENRLEYANGVTGWRAVVTPSDAEVGPHSGLRMYKVTGTDASIPPGDGSASFKLFDYTYTLPSACYLSYWIYVKESPGGLGHITLDGLLESGTRLKDWTHWGVIIDTSGQVMRPASHTVPQGQWVRCIFSLSPAAGQVLKSLSVVYDDGDPAETGPFTAYIDDVQITTEFPAKNVWYAETFGNGLPTATGFELGLAYTDFQGGPCNGGARIKVNGQGNGQVGDWINPTPSLRKDLDPAIALDQNDGLAWRQYDNAYALKLTLLIEDGVHAVWPLIYSWNSPDSWPNAVKQGWVTMSGNPEPHYKVWESFCRNITSDFSAEYGSVPLPLKVVGMRIAHFCNEGGNADSGGVVADIGITGRWLAQQDVPPGSGKAVKDGGWLAYNAGDGKVYAAKGNKCYEFYGYSPQDKQWTDRASILPGTEGKPPSNGAAGCADGNGVIYATKGNNTLGFYRYDDSTDVWTQKHDVPLGPSNKKVKRGTDMVWAYKEGVGHAYLLKGYKNEFWRYHTEGDSWHQLPNAPVGSSERWDKGSWLAYDGDYTIYAHKALRNEFYAFNTETDIWSGPLTGMPTSGSSGSKKAKDGSCGAWLDGCVYALKGNNTQEFWQYNAATNWWLELDTIPKGATGKRIRYGADIATATGFGLFALKGNKSNQFWSYRPAPPGGTDAGFARSVGQPPGQDLGETPIAEGLVASRPRWSPSGIWVTYTKEPAQGRNSEQVYMAPYGLQQFEVKLTDLPGDCESPSFSPGGGQWICFAVEDSSTGRLQIAKVPATTIPQPVVMLTAGNQDEWNPEWSPSGQAIIAQGEDASGSYSQLWLIPADSGSATMLTSGPCDHEEPAFLNPFEVVYLRSPDNGDDQLYKLNIVTMQETPLTFPPLQPERPCPSYDGNFACYQAQNDAGNYQIGRVSGSGGDAHFLTADMFDQEEPDVSPDNVSVHSVRWVGLTSQICRVDAVYGGFLPITDANAIRDNPDSYWNPTSPYNLVVYEREDTSTASPGFGQRPRPRKGTGVFLARSRRLGDGQMAAGNFVFALEKAQPNPAHDRVSISWMVPVEADVSLRVFNTAGQLVKVLVDGRTKPGAYTSVWKGTDAKGRRLANGVYFYALDNGSKRISRKVILTE